VLERIGLVLIGITPWSTTLIRTKYELHSFVLSLHMSSILRQEEECYRIWHCALCQNGQQP